MKTSRMISPTSLGNGGRGAELMVSDGERCRLREGWEFWGGGGDGFMGARRHVSDRKECQRRISAARTRMDIPVAKPPQLYDSDCMLRPLT